MADRKENPVNKNTREKGSEDDHSREASTEFQQNGAEGKKVSVQSIISIILLGLILIFALLNTQEVRINLLVLRVDLPLFLVIIISFLTGGLAALLTSWNKKRKMKKP